MPIPDFQEVMCPLLSYLADDKPHTLSELHDSVRDEFQLTNDDVNKRTNSGRQTILRNCVGWLGASWFNVSQMTGQNIEKAGISERITGRQKQPLPIARKLYPQVAALIGLQP